MPRNANSWGVSSSLLPVSPTSVALKPDLHYLRDQPGRSLTAGRARGTGTRRASCDDRRVLPRVPDPNGILLGYGGLTLDQIERGGTILAGILQQCSRAC
ncbi:MAG: hypothetical protein R2849_18835 [Thermomicrobiales bacterium]